VNILATGMGWINHTPGGLNRYFADYLHALTVRGHRVVGIITTNGDEAGDKPAYMLEAFAGNKPRGSFGRMLAFRSTLRSMLRSGEFDVFNPHFAMYASLLTRGLLPNHMPVITHFHGPWAHESQVEAGGNRLASELRIRAKKSIEMLVYRRSDRFIVLSEYFRDVLTDDYGIPKDRITIIPGAVDIDQFRPAIDRQGLRGEYGIDEQAKVFFCIRRLVKRMGIDHLLRAMAEVIRERPQVRLWIAGDGPQREELRQLAAELGLLGQVEFLGRISQEELVRRYQAADVSVVPTLTLEGFGLVTVESLACGTPVIGTPYGGTREILSRFTPHLLFRDHSPEAMAGLIRRIADGEVTLPERDACRGYVLAHYTWDHVVQSVCEVFAAEAAQKRGLMRA